MNNMSIIRLITKDPIVDRQFPIIIFSIQVAFLSLLILENLNIYFPKLTSALGIVYLTFIPGFMILKIIKFPEEDFFEIILYSVGLSISTLIFLGFFLDIFIPLLGFTKPISFNPLIVVLTIFIILLSIIRYIYIEDCPKNVNFDMKYLLDPKYLFIFLIPPLSIIGVYLMDIYKINLVLLLILFMISLVPIIVIFDNNSIQKHRFHKLILFVISLSLVYHKSLISPYITGTDIFREYIFSNAVLMDAYWDPAMPFALNGMLSIVMLAPIYSILDRIDLIWVFKVIYPFIFSFSSIGLYILIKRQFDERIAFLSSFLFIGMAAFYGIMLEAARQQLADLFLILMLISIFNDNLNNIQKKFLTMIFMFSLVVSHYGVTYIYLFIFIFAYIFSRIMKVIAHHHDDRGRTVNKFINIFIIEDYHYASKFILLFAIGSIGWYIFVSGSVNFNSLVSIFNLMKDDLGFILDPEKTEGLMIIGKHYSITREITKYFYMIVQASIVIGLILYTQSFSTHYKVKVQFFTFSFVYLLFLVLSLLIPNSSSSMGTLRVFHISLILLSPFFVLGFRLIPILFNKFISKFNHINETEASLKLAAIFLTFFILNDSGWACEIFNDYPPNSISLNSSSLHPPSFDIQEKLGGIWIRDAIKGEDIVYCDRYALYFIYSLLNKKYFDVNKSVRPFNIIDNNIHKPSYTFLSKVNLKKNISLNYNYIGRTSLPEYLPFKNSIFYNSTKDLANKIYSSDGVEVYF
jgi:uncharacterized membrane protein